MNYYNDNEKTAVVWLKELIKEGLIPYGEVDDRSITDVAPKDLDGFIQCHFFAGIGGWAYALRLAGWPDEKPVWTGSCPCQPFSVAGKGEGTADERHLWPAFRWIIAQRQPSKVFGEQVAESDGREWISGVRADLEAMGYAVGAADLCAASIGAPHIRQRLWWVADRNCPSAGRVVNYNCERQQKQRCAESMGEKQQGPERTGRNGFRLGDAERSGLPRYAWRRSGSEFKDSNPWDAFEIVTDSEGKTRRIKPGLAPLVDGIPGRVGLVRGYGNAIVPQLAAEFILACVGR